MFALNGSVDYWEGRRRERPEVMMAESVLILAAESEA
jgi:hypothetical protein